MTETRENLCRINWRMSGDLRKLFKAFSDEAAQRTLRAAGGGIIHDAQNNLAAKGWRGLGTAIRSSLNQQVQGRGLEVGASHAAAGMRHFGGTISAPGKGPGAVPAKMLTIPIANEAKGENTRSLRLKGWTIFLPKGTRVLMGTKPGMAIKVRGKGAINPETGRRKSLHMGWTAIPLFVLKKSVRHPASPWFPTSPQITTRIEEAFRAQL